MKWSHFWTQKAQSSKSTATPICAHFIARWQRRLPKEACAPARKTKGKASKSTSIKIAEEEEEAGPEEVAGLEEEEA